MVLGENGCSLPRVKNVQQRKRLGKRNLRGSQRLHNASRLQIQLQRLQILRIQTTVQRKQKGRGARGNERHKDLVAVQQVHDLLVKPTVVSIRDEHSFLPPKQSASLLDPREKDAENPLTHARIRQPPLLRTINSRRRNERLAPDGITPFVRSDHVCARKQLATRGYAADHSCVLVEV